MDDEVNISDLEVDNGIRGGRSVLGGVSGSASARAILDGPTPCKRSKLAVDVGADDVSRRRVAGMDGGGKSGRHVRMPGGFNGGIIRMGRGGCFGLGEESADGSKVFDNVVD